MYIRNVKHISIILRFKRIIQLQKKNTIMRLMMSYVHKHKTLYITICCCSVAYFKEDMFLKDVQMHRINAIMRAIISIYVIAWPWCVNK